MEVSNLFPQDSRPLYLPFISNRRLDNKFNIFEGVTRNYFFMGINVIMIGCQVMIVYVGGKAFNVTRLGGEQWAISVVLGFISIPVGAAIRCIPDAPLIRMTPKFLKKRRKGPEVTISDEEEQFRFPKPLADVKEELSFLKKVKGGRLNNLRFAVQQARDSVMPRSRSGSRSRDNSIPGTPNNGEHARDDSIGSPPPPTPESRRRSRSNRSRSNSALGATAVMAGIIAGSVAGWSPVERREGDTDATRWPRNGNARSELESRKDVEIHPDTKPDDPVIAAEPLVSDLPPSQVEGLHPAAASPKHSTDEKK